MSILDVRLFQIPPNAVRTFRLSQKGGSADQTWDLVRQYRVIGLDWWVANRGANSLDVNVDGQEGVPIAANDNHGESNIRFSIIKVDVGAGAEVFDIVLAGVFLDDLKVRR